MGLKENFQRTSPQSKIIGSFIIPFFIGILGYVLLSYLNYSAKTSLDFSLPAKDIKAYYTNNFTIAISIYSLLILIYIGLFTKVVFPTLDNRAKVITLIVTLVAILIWLTIFIKNYYYYKGLLTTDKKSFICSATDDICITDGTIGSHSGLIRYIFNPPNSKEKMTHIPSEQFDVTNENNLTLSFWLKINYRLWMLPRFFGLDSLILLKGITLDESFITVWGLPNINQIKITVNNTHSYTTDFDFDKWYNYSIVINSKAIEFYKNATLDTTIFIEQSIFIPKLPLYIGQNTLKDMQFPGELMFLTYYNNSLTPDELYSDYKYQYAKISNLDSGLNKKITDRYLERCENDE